jgi:trimethylamine-N-oxide reductase (cytochrome c)
VVIYQQKCIDPLGESKSDYQIFAELARRLGEYDRFTDGGKTEDDWIRRMFDASSMPKYISFEEFTKKGYFVVPIPADYKPTPQMRWFYEGRPCDTPDHLNPKRNTPEAAELGTDSGKIEFVSQSLTRLMPDDEERPPLPRYIPSWEGYQSKLAKKYPLQLIIPHPRFSFHTQYDTHTPWLCDIPGSRIKKDGRYWQVIRINRVDAAARDIKDGDIIRLFNDRASVMGAAQVTERVRPGTVHSYEGSATYDPVEKGKPYSTDRGGCINMLSPDRFMSKNAAGMAPNSCLVEMEKADSY